jgi:hypothetical protein
LKREIVGIAANATNPVRRCLRGSVEWMVSERQHERPAPAHHHMAPPGILHEDLKELSILLGTWKGTGEGVWPPGDPFLVYTQRSWTLEDGSPIHLERGFLRPAGAGRVELVLAHPIGITEVAVGTVDDHVVELASTSVSLTPTASPVTDLRRRIKVANGRLEYELHMAMEGIDLLAHVRSELERV